MPETITQALTNDHRAVLREIAAVRADPRIAPRMYPGIADAIRRHSAAEEATLYQAMRRLSQMDARMVATLEQGHRQIAATLAALDRTPYGSPQFAAGFIHMTQLLMAHVNYEERVVFPHAAKVLPLTRQHALARRYKQMMGKSRRRNVAMGTARNPDCACKNPCACTGCAKTNPRIRRRPRWYHHFAGIGAPIIEQMTVVLPKPNSSEVPRTRTSMTWHSPYTGPRHGRYSTTMVGHGPTYG